MAVKSQKKEPSIGSCWRSEKAEAATGSPDARIANEASKANRPKLVKFGRSRTYFSPYKRAAKYLGIATRGIERS